MFEVRSKGSSEVIDHVDEGVDENLSHLIEGVVTDDAVDGGKLGERDSVISGEDRTSEKMCNDSRLNNEVKEEEGSQEVKVEMCYQQKYNDKLHVVDQGSSCNSRNLVNREVLDPCVVIDSSSQIENFNGDNMKLEAEVNESGLSKVSMKALKGVVSETDKSSCAIDVKCGSYKAFSETFEGEMICRICHLASGQPLEATDTGTTNSATSTDLIQLGCACKDELGIAHSHCAEAWFKLRGNSYI
ncbi:putative E3 ubiquitin-protein ligase MARCH [Lupinus albus]|uniref:Putative E3 ubiquitin-protein ligase MARCH n=1 Tax=Lupinus albus TaxID=3870 RepID=A0A6A4PHZ5_LUPAL|nr:putative E3 ubiquitin-protein ligase MARCH [Lupinus albus]